MASTRPEDRVDILCKLSQMSGEARTSSVFDVLLSLLKSAVIPILKFHKVV